jgi:D-amino-acid oxidase
MTERMPSATPAQVTVVGAGVIGLTCAVRLVEAGHRVTVVTRDPPAETTSAVAAAIWYPYLALPRDRVTAWAAASYEVYARLAETHPEAGVRMRTGREIFRAAQEDPWWASAVPSLGRMAPGTWPTPYVDGWTFTAPTIDMPVYLGWLQRRFEGAGGRVNRRAATDLDAEARGSDVVVVCAGLGARELLGDADLTPVRGQVVVLDNPGLDEFLIDDADPAAMTYVIPRLDTVVCGGTAEAGREDLAPDPAVADAILRRARELVPAVADAPVRAHRVGLRPARSAVRLDREGSIVCCYGHGGAGVTLSWGCAEEVVRLVQGV